MLNKIYKDHKKWINTTKKMGCTQEEAEDIVGEMYCIIGKMLNNGLDISYGDEVNYYYIYMTLRTTFLQMKNRQKKMNNVSLDFVLELEEEQYINFDEENEKIEQALEKLHWYDRKVYNLLQDDYSIRELAEKTNITYHSLYNTFRKVKAELKKEII
jgi:DNA-directed RNA polymerase specialized sigma24 family protein